MRRHVQRRGCACGGQNGIDRKERIVRQRGVRRNPARDDGDLGGASGLALFGSAASDVLGFLIISQSRMGFFSLFGTFSAAMIFFSLIASLILACGLIGVLNYRKVLGEHREDREMSA